jgi:hypothetical protein
MRPIEIGDHCKADWYDENVWDYGVITGVDRERNIAFAKLDNHRRNMDFIELDGQPNFSGDIPTRMTTGAGFSRVFNYESVRLLYSPNHPKIHSHRRAGR